MLYNTAETVFASGVVRCRIIRTARNTHNTQQLKGDGGVEKRTIGEGTMIVGSESLEGHEDHGIVIVILATHKRNLYVPN